MMHRMEMDDSLTLEPYRRDDNVLLILSMSI